MTALYQIKCGHFLWYFNYSSIERNNSLIPTLPKVFASTFFTITAQYKLYLPHLDGRLPETTTEPAGTRP